MSATPTNKYLEQFNNELSKYPFLNKIEQRTQIPKVFGASGFLVVYFLIIFLNIGGIGQLFSNLAAVVVPGYLSLQALETPGTNDDTQYLTYWVVYAVFTILEFWSSMILYWVPFWWLFKTIFFLWLGLPQTNGAQIVYTNVLRPFSINVLGIRGGGVASNLNEKVSAHTSGARF